MPFGLEYLIALYASKLADGTVDRAYQRGVRQWSGTDFQGACKKVVERFVVGNVRFCRFRHIDLITPNKPADDARGDRPATVCCNPAGKHGQSLLGEQVLQKDDELLRQLDTLDWGYSGRQKAPEIVPVGLPG